jgi:hypothetical protein
MPDAMERLFTAIPPSSSPRELAIENGLAVSRVASRASCLDANSLALSSIGSAVDS